MEEMYEMAGVTSNGSPCHKSIVYEGLARSAKLNASLSRAVECRWNALLRVVYQLPNRDGLRKVDREASDA